MYSHMKFFLIPIAVAAVLSGQAVVSPEVAADGRVTFRIAAPKAAEVLFYGDFMPVGATKPMQKDAAGVWSLTTDPLPPSVYIYHFVVDGMTIADPVPSKTPTPKVR
jgi:1,4-alpha-glucan branching enzyme